MKRFTTAVALVATLLIAGTAQAAPGPAPAGTAIAEYNFITGEIVVSGAPGLSNWYVESASSSLNGPDNGTDTLPLDGGLVTDNDSRIGETVLLGITGFTDHDLGFVASALLPQADLTVSSNAGLAEPLFTFAVSYINVPEPTTLALAAFGLCGILVSRRRR